MAAVAEKEWLSQSRVTNWSRCPFRYKLIHIDKLVRRWTPAPMKRGTLVHAGLQFALWWCVQRDRGDAEVGRKRVSKATRTMAYPTGTAMEWGEAAISNAQLTWLAEPAIAPHVTEELRQGAMDQVHEAQVIFRRVWAFLGVESGKWKTVLLKDGTPLIEYKMRIPHCLGEHWAGFQGTLDWVTIDTATGHIWLFDLKTLKALQSDDYHFMQIQAPVYQFLLKNLHGLELVGTGTVQARAAVPQIPHLNKTKTAGQDRPGMSRSKLATDPETYTAALKAEGLDPNDYADYIADLKPFDRISYAYRGPEQVAQIWKELNTHADMMAAAETSRTFPRAAHPYGCRGCTHRTFCESDLLGEDTEWLAQTEYMREGETPFPVVEIEEDDDYD
jgi:hypothetical protein